jgi:hypothetical protein
MVFCFCCRVSYCRARLFFDAGKETTKCNLRKKTDWGCHPVRKTSDILPLAPLGSPDWGGKFRTMVLDAIGEAPAPRIHRDTVVIFGQSGVFPLAPFLCSARKADGARLSLVNFDVQVVVQFMRVGIPVWGNRVSKNCATRPRVFQAWSRRAKPRSAAACTSQDARF